MKILFILNDPPYGSERSYNALRLAKNLLQQDPQLELTLFLMADAVGCAKAGQRPPAGYYNIELMLNALLRHAHTRVLLCGTCLDARGLAQPELIAPAQRSDMDTLGQATLAADKVLVY